MNALRHLSVLFFICLVFIIQTKAQDLSWSHVYNSTTADDYSSVATDAVGNIYHTVSFTGTIDADPGPGITSFTSTGASDACIAKYDDVGNLIFAFSITGTASVTADIITDISGNLIISGTFNNGTIDLDPGAGLFSFTTTGQQQYVAKYDATGQFLWGKSIEGTGTMYFQDIALDGAGNIYTAGAFSGSIDFDPTAAIFNMDAVGLNDEYILKLDGNGNFSWARSRPAIGGLGIIAYALAVDVAGNVYTTGAFSSTVDFDPGPGTFNFTTGSQGDAYLAKLNTAGNFEYAIRISNSTGTDYGKGMTIDGSGSNIYITGSFEQTTDLDPGPATLLATSNGQTDVFVAKYNSASGTLVWAKVLTGNFVEIPEEIATDAAGNVYSAGYYIGQLDFDPGAGTHIINADLSLNTYISKLNSSGAFLWAGIMYGNQSNSPQGLVANICGDIHLTGEFSGTMDIEPGSRINTITSAGLSNDVYFIKLSQSYWTGNVSTNWFDPLNWACNTLPGIRSNVIIPTGAIRFPILTATAEVKSIVLQPAASMQVESGVEFKVNNGN